MVPPDTHLQIGSLLFEGLDQIDLTGPFEILPRIPNSTYRIFGKTAEPVRDVRGLRLGPDARISRCVARRPEGVRFRAARWRCNSAPRSRILRWSWVFGLRTDT